VTSGKRRPTLDHHRSREGINVTNRNLARLERDAAMSRRTMGQLAGGYAVGVIGTMTRAFELRTTLGAIWVVVMSLLLLLLCLVGAHYLFSLRPRLLEARRSGASRSILDRLETEERWN